MGKIIDKYKKRESGLELLKIIAIFLIVLSHTIKTIGTQNLSMCDSQNIFFNWSIASMNIEINAVKLMRVFAFSSNFIFMICTAWFLTKSKKVKINKVANIVLDVFLISVIILFILLLCGVNIPFSERIKAFLPTLLSSNWYITCYILIYLIHPLLNICIEKISEKNFRYLVYGLLFIIIINTVKSELLFFNNILLFISVYFITAYLQKYQIERMNNKKINYTVLIISIISLLATHFIINFLGTKTTILQNKGIILAKNYNVFDLMIAFSLFNIFRSFKFKNTFINYISSLSMLVYIIHENRLIAEYIRPVMYEKVYYIFGHNMLILQVLGLALIIFILSTIISILYRATLQKITESISNKLKIEINYE